MTLNIGSTSNQNKRQSHAYSGPLKPSPTSVWPLGFDADPNILFVRAYHQGFEAIFKVNLTDPKLTKELVYANEDTDVEGSLIYSELKKKSLGLVKATVKNILLGS